MWKCHFSWTDYHVSFAISSQSKGELVKGAFVKGSVSQRGVSQRGHQSKGSQLKGALVKGGVSQKGRQSKKASVKGGVSQKGFSKSKSVNRWVKATSNNQVTNSYCWYWVLTSKIWYIKTLVFVNSSPNRLPEVIVLVLTFQYTYSNQPIKA